MRTRHRTLVAVALLAFSAAAQAQPAGRGPGGPGGGPGGGGPGGGAPGGGRGGDQTPQTADTFIAKMMAFDADGDHALARKELTDARLLPLFDRADADKDGVVTKAELTALLEKESAALAANRGGGPPDAPGDNGGPGGGGAGGGPGGPGGPGGRMGRPQPGQILPAGLQDQLQLSAEQKAQVDALQKDVDAKLAKILTAEQQQQLKQAGQRGGPPGRGGPGGRDGQRGPGGPGGPPSN